MGIAQDLRYAWRTFRKNPGFPLVAILTLALGIGATTAMFSVVYSVLLRPLPFQEPGPLVAVYQTSRTDPREPILLSDFEILKSQSRSFSDLAIYYKNTGFSRVTLTVAGEPESVQGGFVSANLLPLLGVKPAVGRSFTAEEQARRERVVVLSDGLWRRRFDGSLDAVGRTLEIDRIPFQIIGVMPARFQFPARETQFWAPITTSRYWLEHPAIDPARARGFYARWNVVARLNPGVSLAQTSAELGVLAKRFELANPALNHGLGTAVVPLRVELSGATQLALYVLLSAVFFVLLIACANVANLILARGASREREMAIRTALGAERIRLVRQLLTESGLLAGIAGCLGVLLAEAGIRAIRAYAPGDLPRLEQTGLDVWVMAFAFGISIVAALLAGVFPAFKISGSLARGSAAAFGLGRMRAALVVLEFALTVVLLTGAGLLIRSFVAVQAVDPGFVPEHVLTMKLTLPAGVKNPIFYQQLLERIQVIPGVTSAGAIDAVFESNDTVRSNHAAQFTGGLPRVWATWKSIRGDYLGAMGIRLLRGRNFNQQDNTSAPLVALIDESMARRYWPGENALGKQFRGQDARGRNDDPLTVVGVIRDVRTRGRETLPAPHVFQPAEQSGEPTQDLVVRTAGDPVQVAGVLRQTARSVDRNAIVSQVATLEQQLTDQLSARSFRTRLLSLFSVLALILASVGIYGVMRYAVAQRAREIGIRMAVGAQVSSVVALVLRQALTLALGGLICGLAGAVWLTQALSSLLFGVTATDPATYLLVAMVLLSAAIGATLIPAIRAARIDPLEALRQQ